MTRFFNWRGRAVLAALLATAAVSMSLFAGCSQGGSGTGSTTSGKAAAQNVFNFPGNLFVSGTEESALRRQGKWVVQWFTPGPTDPTATPNPQGTNEYHKVWHDVTITYTSPIPTPTPSHPKRLELLIYFLKK